MLGFPFFEIKGWFHCALLVHISIHSKIIFEASPMYHTLALQIEFLEGDQIQKPVDSLAQTEPHLVKTKTKWSVLFQNISKSTTGVVVQLFETPWTAARQASLSFTISWSLLKPWVMKSRTWLSNFTFTFHFCAMEKEMATHSSVLAWRIPGTGEPGGLPSMGSHRVGHDWSGLAAAAGSSIISIVFQGSHTAPKRLFWTFKKEEPYMKGYRDSNLKFNGKK